MSDPNERVARCEYDGLPALDGPQCCQGVRRTGKTITNQGTGIEPDSSDYYGNVTPVEIGDRHEQVRHLPAGGTPAPCGTGNLPVNLRLVELRNGSDQTLGQWVWGTQYVDELLLLDVNADPAASNVCDPDANPNHAAGDRRYFPLTRRGSRREPVRAANAECRSVRRVKGQDRNWNVAALTEYDDGVGVRGRKAEGYAYTPYGDFVVLKGDAGSGELGQALVASGVGNIFFHQGLVFDQEKGSYQNRWREYLAPLQRLAQSDPLLSSWDKYFGISLIMNWLSSDSIQTLIRALPFPEILNRYRYVANTPLILRDPSGGCAAGCQGCACACNTAPYAVTGSELAGPLQCAPDITSVAECQNYRNQMMLLGQDDDACAADPNCSAAKAQCDGAKGRAERAIAQ